MLLTCKQLASNLGVDYLQASSIIKVLIKSGVASISKTIKGEGRGRPTVSYEVPERVIIDLSTGEVSEGG